MRCSCVPAILALALGQPALADLSWGFPHVDKGELLPGYITRDLVVTTDSEWFGAELLITLDTGSFYQHPYGTVGPPEAGMISLFPELEFDTYLTGGTPDSDPGGLTCGGAVDLGGTPGVGNCQFDESEIDVTWYRMQPSLVGDLMVARLTLSSDASGSWKLRISNQDEGARTITGEACTILNSRFGIQGRHIGGWLRGIGRLGCCPFLLEPERASRPVEYGRPKRRRLCRQRRSGHHPNLLAGRRKFHRPLARRHPRPRR